MQNWFASFALLMWPVVALWLYSTRSAIQATLWTIIAAMLVLPVGASVKIPGVPQFDKVSIPNICALIGCALFARKQIPSSGRFGAAQVLVAMALIAPFITSELNTDAIIIADRFLPASSHYDAVSAMVAQYISLIPFFVGRRMVRSSEDTIEVLRVMVIAGAIYSIPILFEVRMSPQLHNWVYGYQPSEFIQQVRAGGYRAVVFLGHGLLTAFFIATTAIAAAALWRMRLPVMRLSPGGLMSYLLVILALCRSLGPVVYGAILVPIVRFAGPRLQVKVAIMLVVFSLFYPMLRLTDAFPTKFLVDTAAATSVDRAGSLQFRFDNEDRLLTHASKRLWFGWGRFGRARVYNEDTGKDDSVTDGAWIITLGTFGLFGFSAVFGLLTLPVFRAWSSIRRAQSAHDAIALAALSLILAVNVIDLLPNASLTPCTWLLAGALLGRAEVLRLSVRPVQRARTAAGHRYKTVAERRTRKGPLGPVPIPPVVRGPRLE
jgi:hypothetical protein